LRAHLFLKTHAPFPRKGLTLDYSGAMKALFNFIKGGDEVGKYLIFNKPMDNSDSSNGL